MTYTVLNVFGPNATHHLTSTEGWRQRGSYLTDAAALSGVEKQQRDREAHKASRTQAYRPSRVCPCGARVRSTKFTDCRTCRKRAEEERSGARAYSS